jgi:hypothetical protein
MAISVGTSTITFNDSTTQSTAATTGFSNMVVLTATNASYSIPATKIKITVVGGGGGAWAGAAGGGGAAVKILSGLTIGNTLNVTIGAGGTFNANGSATSGGTTSVASGSQTISTISATGGGASVNANGGGGGGGSGSGGDLNLTGNQGIVDTGSCAATGYGGASALIGRPYGQGGGNLGGGASGGTGLVIIEY